MTQQVALVTGAGGSIGTEISKALAGAGFAIAVNDIKAEPADACVAMLTAAGHRARSFLADISDAAAVNAMVADIEAEFGPLGALVNNAGVPGPFSLLVDLDDDVWARTLNVHLTGSFYLVRAVARRMIPRNVGRIVSIASVAGLRGTVGSGEYGAAKAGMICLTMTAAKELAPFGITANAIAPGMVGTEINRSLADQGSRFIQTALDATPDGSLVPPADIAGLVAYLCSPAAARINGVTMPIDGASTLEMGTDSYMRRSLGKRSPFLKGLADDPSA
ncbi:SDR family NAD(P)-dependent oxidoreductase [Hoeflea alexandrii]|uniref:SDR family NAD(P)-dependent oxidoreductase n=1 Tax=Hoeflea alexandrii TaxID=288436 RepID=UPI0022B0098B|nr:SDR family NAD(P)-dependent oxidoreductase [Hoeflea alexandrii]MCZ4291662.1 SDR family NAD(P)-dependent oxidoreductase [Hoeflea alexandrii]